MIVDPENWYLNKAESINNPPTSPPPFSKTQVYLEEFTFSIVTY